MGRPGRQQGCGEQRDRQGETAVEGLARGGIEPIKESSHTRGGPIVARPELSEDVGCLEGDDQRKRRPLDREVPDRVGQRSNHRGQQPRGQHRERGCRGAADQSEPTPHSRPR